MRSSVVRLGLSVLVTLAILDTPVRGDESLIEIDDAFIAASADGWTIGNGLIQYAVGNVGGGVVGVRGIREPATGRDWNRASAPDTVVRIDGQAVNIGTAITPFVRAEISEWFGGVRLDLRYRYNRLDIVRSYACYPGSSVVEVWTTFREPEHGETVSLSELANYSLNIQNGTLSWISGLEAGDVTTVPFSRLSGDLDDGQIFDLGSDRRSSEYSLPWFSIRAENEEFFGSILWSGSWRFHSERKGEQVHVEIGLPGFKTELLPGASLETPHAVFGLTSPVVPDTATALRGFIQRGVRHGRPLNAYVTYNTWYSSGTFLDEASMLAEMQLAAGIGVEQFVIDAGWWKGANQNDASDFMTNWGNWQVDLDRFPNGLGYLSDRAHELGMRFGIWVEPERVDRRTVGQPGLAKERFLASGDVNDDPVPVGGNTPARRRARPRIPLAMAQPSNPADQPVSAQVCLVDGEARAWVMDKLVGFIEETRPDYLKWDNNLWVNCTRTGHGHGLEDGNFTHHRALQTVLDELRDRFPTLDIENCASGGNRLSLDMLARTDSAWMDDRTDIGSRVRHEVQGLLALLPTPYLLSFAVGTQETFDDNHVAEMPYVLRSRMLGVPGISWVLRAMADDTLDGTAREMAMYKRLRPFQQYGATLLLSGQVQPPAAGAWDAVEFLMPGAADAAVMAYNAPDAPEIARLRLRGLQPDAFYTVESADAGVLGVATGRDLMDRGVELSTASAALGHMLFLHAE